MWPSIFPKKDFDKEKKEEHERLVALQARFEKYVAGTICIGLSPYCRGKKSKGAMVCKACYMAQGFDRPIGFAQSGGGATREELVGKVASRLSFQKGE